jgi:hypothetical protein
MNPALSFGITAAPGDSLPLPGAIGRAILLCDAMRPDRPLNDVEVGLNARPSGSSAAALLADGRL